MTRYPSDSELRCLEAFATGDLLNGLDKFVVLIENFRLEAVEHLNSKVIWRQIIDLLEIARKPASSDRTVRDDRDAD